jgi:hypothetical protein
MTTYLVLLGAHAMDHIPDEDMPAVDEAAHAVCQEAINAGVWVCGGGLPDQKASIVTTDGMVTAGPSVTIGGIRYGRPRQSAPAQSSSQTRRPR